LSHLFLNANRPVILIEQSRLLKPGFGLDIH